MNFEDQLNIQAYADGELSGAAAAKIEQRLAADPEARRLLRELNHTKQALASGEPEYKLPESREFFWSKLERDIRRQTPSAVRPGLMDAIAAWAHRHLAPLATATAVFAAVLILAASRPWASRPVADYAEAESLMPDISLLTYRSQSDQMTVIWLYDRTRADGAAVAEDFHD